MLKRFDIEADGADCIYVNLRPDGHFVKYSEVAELEAENKELKGWLRQMVENIKISLVGTPDEDWGPWANKMAELLHAQANNRMYDIMQQTTVNSF